MVKDLTGVEGSSVASHKWNLFRYVIPVGIIKIYVPVPGNNHWVGIPLWQLGGLHGTSLFLVAKSTEIIWLLLRLAAANPRALALVGVGTSKTHG